MIPWCKNFTKTTHRTNKDSLGGMSDSLGGVGQWNAFSESVHRDTSYFVL